MMIKPCLMEALPHLPLLSTLCAEEVSLPFLMACVKLCCYINIAFSFVVFQTPQTSIHHPVNM